MTAMDYAVRYSQEAIEDLREIYLYIAHELKVPSIAKGQINRIEQAIHGLSTFPNRHELVGWEPWQSMNMRRLRVGNYLVFYRASNDERVVEIVRIFYAGMNVEDMAKRDGIVDL